MCEIKRYVRVSSICVLVFDILGFASVSLRFNLELKLALSNLWALLAWSLSWYLTVSFHHRRPFVNEYTCVCVLLQWRQQSLIRVFAPSDASLYWFNNLILYHQEIKIAAAPTEVGSGSIFGRSRWAMKWRNKSDVFFHFKQFVQTEAPHKSFISHPPHWDTSLSLSLSLSHTREHTHTHFLSLHLGLAFNLLFLWYLVKCNLIDLMAPLKKKEFSFINLLSLCYFLESILFMLISHHGTVGS